MKINSKRISLLEAIIILIAAGDLFETLRCHTKGESLSQEIRDEAFYICQSAAEDGGQK